jgi:hypothetical protein
MYLLYSCTSTSTPLPCQHTLPFAKMNIPAILSLFRVARDPSICLPHATVATFADLPIPLSRAFAPRRLRPAFAASEELGGGEPDRNKPTGYERDTEEQVDIRAVVLDKDNCFAVPKTDEVCPEYSVCRLSAHVVRARADIKNCHTSMVGYSGFVILPPLVFYCHTTDSPSFL